MRDDGRHSAPCAMRISHSCAMRGALFGQLCHLRHRHLTEYRVAGSRRAQHAKHRPLWTERPARRSTPRRWTGRRSIRTPPPTHTHAGAHALLVRSARPRTPPCRLPAPIRRGRESGHTVETERMTDFSSQHCAVVPCSLGGALALALAPSLPPPALVGGLLRAAPDGARARGQQRRASAAHGDLVELLAVELHTDT